MSKSEKALLVSLVPLSAVGMYELSGEAWGAAYESGKVSAAEQEVSCAEELQDIQGPLPVACDLDKLERLYAQEPEVKEEWSVEDGLLHRSVDRGTAFEDPKQILADAKSNLARVEDGENDYKHERGLYSTIAVGGLAAAAGILMWRKNRAASRPEKSPKKSGGRLKKFGRNLTSLKSQTKHDEPQLFDQERELVEVGATED